ncbi:putative mitochondrial protein, partial [Tanacetum coccineum]
PVIDDDNMKLLKLDENTADHVRTGLTPKYSDMDVIRLQEDGESAINVDAELEGFKTDVETKFQSLEDRFRSGLADLKAELKADAARQQAESDKRHEQLLVTNQSGVRFDDLGFAYPDNVEKPECSDHKNKRGGKTVRFGEKGPRFYGNKDRNHGNRIRKLKMPVFEGEDAYGWIYRVKRYFEIQGIPSDERVLAAAVCMEGDALSWHRWSEGQTPFYSWDGFKRQGMAREYVAMFEKLACQLAGVSRSGSVNQQGQFKWLTEAEFSKKRSKGLCFKCDEKYVPGHRCPIKSLQVLLVGDNEDDIQEDEHDVSHVHLDAIEVSLNSVIGFTSPRTMKIRGSIGGLDVVVLIDYGATHNFISHRVVEQLALMVSGTTSVGVMMGNGKFEQSLGLCKEVVLALPELQIVEDFFPLKLGSTYVILGFKWLQTLGETSNNWKELTMTFDHGEKRITIKGDRGLCRSLVSIKSLLRVFHQEKEGFLV